MKNSMFVWLTRMCICHFGVLDPKFMRGAYTGVGRAKYLIECLNGTSKNDSFKVKKNFIIFVLLLTQCIIFVFKIRTIMKARMNKTMNRFFFRF